MEEPRSPARAPGRLALLLREPASAGAAGAPANRRETSAAAPARGLIEAARRAIVAVRAVAPPGGRGQGGGLGFVVDPGGFVVTSHRLVEGARALEVALADGRRLPVTLVARDPLSDLAVLKVDGRDLPAVALGESGALRVGEPVVAPGPGPEGAAVATGRITATSHATGGDLALELSPGSSRIGAPVLNGRGEVVGMSTAAGAHAGAVPIDRVKPILRALQRRAAASGDPGALFPAAGR